MLELILGTAQDDPRVRAVIMNGSRVNPNAPKDCFQDYDVVYAVTDVSSFTYDHSWLKRFGELMIMQLPDLMGDDPAPPGERFAYLMQFADGNRIDLTLFPVHRLAQLQPESLSVLLLDKDGIVEPFAPPSEASYLPRPPTPKQYGDCCNEFWWVAPYVAKGLWRDEPIYALSMLDLVRGELVKMLTWHIGAGTGFAVSPGKSGKYFRRYLRSELWDLLVATYPRANPDEIWDALLTMCRLFRVVALDVSERLNGLAYPHGDDRRVSAHLLHVRALPRDATEMY